MNICHEIKLAEKLTCILEERRIIITLLFYIYIYIHLFFSQCTYMKTIFFQIIAEQFTTASCTFINNILCRKIEIESDNHIYNAAKRISQKFSKKESE